MADTVPAMLEPGEFVIRKDAVDEIGLPVLKMLNQADRMQEFNEGGSVMGQNGHSAIDELIALNSLKNFSQGGIVKEGMQGYQQGGKVIKGSREVEYSMDDPNVMKLVMSVPASEVGGGDGLRYYSAEKEYGNMPNLDMQILAKRARQKMSESPSDSMAYESIDSYLKPASKVPKFLKMFGMQEGGQVSADPLGIDARSANQLMYQGSIIEGAGGMYNPIQDARDIVSQLELLKMVKDMESPENFENLRKEMGAPSNEEIMKALDFLFKAREAGVNKFQSGGYVPQVGGPAREDVEDIYGDKFLKSSQFTAFDPEAYGVTELESDFQAQLSRERGNVFGGDPVLDRDRLIEEKARENQRMLRQSYIAKDRQKQASIDDYFEDQLAVLRDLEDREMTRGSWNKREQRKRKEARENRKKNRPWYAKVGDYLG
tara:strand:+ start:575 stop:1864 length:1290 start_codon:yes stop_codon:yes gene_type:complete